MYCRRFYRLRLIWPGFLARSGRKVSLRMGVPKAAPKDTSAFEVIALKCRTSPVSDAVRETRAALAWLKEAGAQRFFWKYCSTFDSTDEGNIGPVAEALMADLDASQTIYCPAFPENGRSIFMGNLFVGEQPLAESPMKDHPLTPMRDSNLMRLLEPQVTRPVGLINRLTVAQGADAVRKALASAPPHVVVDAVADADLQIIAEACHDMALMTGGSAVAMPLPDIYAAQGLIGTDAPDLARPDLGTGTIVLLWQLLCHDQCTSGRIQDHWRAELPSRPACAGAERRGCRSGMAGENRIWKPRR